MKKRIEVVCVGLLVLLSVTAAAQNDCNGPTEKLVGEKGSIYTIPCKDMVIMDIETYSKYRFMEKQFHKMDSTVSGYTSKLDSLDKENKVNKDLLETKLQNKDDIIIQYQHHSKEIAAVLEKCKTDSEGFVKRYQEKVDENHGLEKKIVKLKKQRKGFMAVSGGLAVFVVLLLL
jgi:hypothetical protein